MDRIVDTFMMKNQGEYHRLLSASSTFKNIQFRMGERYQFIHKNGCTHSFIFSDIQYSFQCNVICI